MLDGEQVHLDMVERVIVSPGAGIFVPDDALAEGAHVDVGDLLGRVGDAEVRSLFAGTIGSLIAVAGERLSASQPIVWLRTGSPSGSL